MHVTKCRYISTAFHIRILWAMKAIAVEFNKTHYMIFLFDQLVRTEHKPTTPIVVAQSSTD